MDNNISTYFNTTLVSVQLDNTKSEILEKYKFQYNTCFGSIFISTNPTDTYTNFNTTLVSVQL